MQAVTPCSFHLHKARILGPSMGDSLPEAFDLVVVGTGLVESMVAAAAARLGHTVLHLDTRDYYGGDWAAFTWDGLQKWVKDQKGDEEEKEEETREGEKAEFKLGEGERLVVLGKGSKVDKVVETWGTKEKEAGVKGM